MDAHLNNLKYFTLSDGGPFYKAMVKLRLLNIKRLAIAALCITWLPLVVLTAMEGTLFSGTQLPFLSDVAMQARVLVALPMLILIKSTIEDRVSAVLRYILETLVTAEQRAIIVDTTLMKARKLTSSTLTELLLLLGVIIATISLVKGGVYGGLEKGTTSWMTTPQGSDPGLSTAGYWAVLISIPVFQFLFASWVWRYIVWILLLFQLSKVHLNLLPTHADRAGGLGMIMLAQKSFNLLFVVSAIVISGQFIVELIKHPDQFEAIRNEVIGYILVCIAFVLIPLLFFSGKLLRVKNNGLHQLSVLAASLSHKFEREWINDSPVEDRIEESKSDPSLLYDYAGMYEQLQKLRVVPVALNDITGLALALLVPFIPILFVHFSVGELLQRIGGMVA